MAENKSGIELVQSINKEWLADLETDTDLQILMYEPFTEDYWKEKYKIVLCNLEPGGDKPVVAKNEILGFDGFKYWHNEKRHTTVRNSSKFLYCLYETLKGKTIEKKDLETAKNDNELLLNCMEKVTYMNLLQDVGNGAFNKEAKEYFWQKFYNKGNKNRERIVNLINALDPDIFVVTSDDGCDLIKELFNKKFENHLFVYNNRLFVGLGHPSRSFGMDDYVLDKVNVIMEGLKTYNLLKK